MKFLYALQIDQGYLAHTPTGTGVPPKNFNRENWPKIQRVRLNNFRVSGTILTALFSVDAPRGRGDKLGTIFYNARPLKFVTAKKSPKIFRDNDNFRL